MRLILGGLIQTKDEKEPELLKHLVLFPLGVTDAGILKVFAKFFISASQYFITSTLDTQLQYCAGQLLRMMGISLAQTRLPDHAKLSVLRLCLPSMHWKYAE